MAHGKQTSKSAATKASKTLTIKSAGKKSRSAAGSALSQSKTRNVTSKKAATKASGVLRDGRSSAKAKSAAGSALSQRHRAKSGR